MTLFIYLLCLGSWLGGMMFFSFITAPILFSRLPLAEAGKVVSGIFPLYYLAGYVTGIISVISAIYLAISRPAHGWWSVAAGLLALALALTFYAGLVVRPKTERVRTVVEEANPDPVRRAQFDALHRLSVQLNGAVMVLDVLALASTAAALTRHG